MKVDRELCAAQELEFRYSYVCFLVVEEFQRSESSCRVLNHIFDSYFLDEGYSFSFKN